MSTEPQDLTALRDIANAATPGPWSAEPYLYGLDSKGRIRVTSPSDSDDHNLADDVAEQDANHIAAFDPPTVLALIARATAAEAAIARVREVVEAYGEQSHKCGSGDCCRCTLDDFRGALDAP